MNGKVLKIQLKGVLFFRTPCTIIMFSFMYIALSRSKISTGEQWDSTSQRAKSPKSSL